MNSSDSTDSDSGVLDPIQDSQNYEEMVVKDEDGRQLEEFVVNNSKRFKPGCAFVELKDKREDIDANKKVILKNKVCVNIKN